MAKNKRQAELAENAKHKVLMQGGCNLCPLSCRLKPEQSLLESSPLDILVVSDKTPYMVSAYSFKDKSLHHVFRLECGYLNEPDNADAMWCCAGRKQNEILTRKPQLVISVGFQSYKAIELLCGNKVKTVPEIEPLPSKMKGHVFWHLPLPDVALSDINHYRKEIMACLDIKPCVFEEDYDLGIEFVSNAREHQAATADLLLANTKIGFDIETINFRPYLLDSDILTIALSSGLKTFAWSIGHPQTFSSAPKRAEVLNAYYDIGRANPSMIVHNGMFEQEWMGYEGLKYIFDINYDDTMAIAHLFNYAQNSLEYCVRRNLGFDLKKLSGDIDRARLAEYPLEQVLLYNARDAKFTKLLFEHINIEKPGTPMQKIYRYQVSRETALANAQITGAVPNVAFIHEETEHMQAQLMLAREDIQTDPVFDQFYSLKRKQFNPASDDDVKTLFTEIYGVENILTTDKQFLHLRKEPIAQKLLTFRDYSKAFNTYLAPLDPLANHENAGKAIFPDGLIHTSFNPMKAVTGRLSSSNPNLQNQPKRARKDLRNAIRALEQFYIVCVDYGQIEYRLLGALSRDKIIIDSLVLNNMDVHMHWAQLLDKAIPGKFVKDPSDPKQMDKFRSRVKNEWTFPLCYGAGEKKIFALLDVHSKKEKDAIREMITEFWRIHHAVRAWQYSLDAQLKQQGYIENAFGRRYFAPLSFNQACNYPVQGTGSGDLPLIAMDKLARLGWEMGEMDLAPFINVHDDLTYLIHQDRFDKLMPLIIENMLDTTDFDSWLSPIPLTVEVSLGRLWGTQHKLGTYDSRDWKKKLHKKEKQQ